MKSCPSPDEILAGLQNMGNGHAPPEDLWPAIARRLHSHRRHSVLPSALAAVLLLSAGLGIITLRIPLPGSRIGPDADPARFAGQSAPALLVAREYQAAVASVQRWRQLSPVPKLTPEQNDINTSLAVLDRAARQLTRALSHEAKPTLLPLLVRVEQKRLSLLTYQNFGDS